MSGGAGISKTEVAFVLTATATLGIDYIEELRANDRARDSLLAALKDREVRQLESVYEKHIKIDTVLVQGKLPLVSIRSKFRVNSAQHALIQIVGQDLGEGKEAWLRWWEKNKPDQSR
jgi:hypothetical protein